MVETADRSPMGVKVICVWTALQAVFGVAVGFGLVGLGGQEGTPQLLGALGVGMWVLSAVALAAAYGLWTVRPWGWSLGTGLYVVSVLLGITALALGRVASVFSLVINGAILAYLLMAAPLYGKSVL